MKKKWLLIISVIVMFAIPNCVSTASEASDLTAEDETEELQAADASDFIYVNNGTEVQINGYCGDGGVVVIPDTIEGNLVTRIADGAFMDAANITGIVLPNHLEYIGDLAFFWLDNLTGDLILPSTVKRVGDCAFQCCGITGIVIQSDCEIIGNAFANMDNLSFVFIKEGCSPSIDVSVFSYAGELTTVILPESIVNIEDETFNGCNKMVIYTTEGSYAQEYANRNFIQVNTKYYEAKYSAYCKRYEIDETEENETETELMDIEEIETETELLEAAEETSLTIAENTETEAETEPTTISVEESGSEIDGASLNDDFVAIQNGDSSDVVQKIQQILIDAGYLTGSADGIFGNMTEQAVKNFQAAKGLEETGIVDSDTYSLLLEENIPEGMSIDEDEWEAWESTDSCGGGAFIKGCKAANMTYSLGSDQQENHKVGTFVFIEEDGARPTLKDATFYYGVKGSKVSYVGLYTADEDVYNSDDFKEACIRLMMAYNVHTDSDSGETVFDISRERAEEIIDYCFDNEIEHCVVDNMRIRLLRETEDDENYYSFHIER